MDLFELTAKEMLAKLEKKEISSQELLSVHIKRIQEVERSVHSFVTLSLNNALKQAEDIDNRRMRGESLGPLAGIPVAIKDNMCIKGVRTTCSSKILESFVSPYNATVIEKLKGADAVFIGKTNMDEFAMGSSTETSYLGTTRNPWDTDRIPGGSSGGSATACASGEAPLALGSDTGGSIRQPASLSGVVGLKPTYGRVSRYGLVAFASSLDQIGPIARDVEDCAVLLGVISGYDNRDSTSVNREVPKYSKDLKKSIKGISIGVPREYFAEGLDKEVEEAVRKGIETLQKQGCRVREISLPHTEYAVATYYIVAPSEASANLARYDGVKYGYRSRSGEDLIDVYEETRGDGFGPEVKRRIMLGTYALSSGYYDAYYLKAQKVRTLIKQDFENAFKDVDVIITPTSPTPAFKIGEKMDDPLKMYLSDIYTISANLAGIPGISIPCGFSGEGLPIGMQILAKAFDEETILRVAYRYQEVIDWLKKRPKI